MRIIILVAFITNCFSQNVFSAEFIKTNSIDVIDNILISVDSKAIVIFDVDDVLMIPKDEILKTKNQDICKKLVKSLKNKVGKEEIRELISIILMNRKTSTVEAKMVDLVEKLQKNHVKVLGLTNSATGKFGLINNIEDFRISELKRHNYHFEKSWETVHEIVFNMIDSKPVFREGVLFVDQTGEKASVLEEFLKKITWNPEKIIFIDDKISNLEAVSKFAKQNNIEFIGIEYRKAFEENSNVNYEIASLQFKILEYEKRWVSDENAKILLEDLYTTDN